LKYSFRCNSLGITRDSASIWRYLSGNISICWTDGIWWCIRRDISRMDLHRSRFYGAIPMRSWK
jgi:hypothetical protein